MDKHIIRKLFIVINFGLFFLWGYLLFHGIIYGPDSGQRGVFFGGSDDWFMDFYNVIYFSVGKSPYSWGYSAHRPYLPLSYMILYPLTVFYSYDSLEWGVQYMSRYNQLMAIAGAVYLVISFGILFYCLYKACKNTEIEKIFILAALFCSGITIFNFDRANLIILSAALSCIFLMTYDSGNRLYRHLGFMSLAISAALKLFPALFGVVLLYKKQYKDVSLKIYNYLFKHWKLTQKHMLMERWDYFRLQFLAAMLSTMASSLGLSAVLRLLLPKTPEKNGNRYYFFHLP